MKDALRSKINDHDFTIYNENNKLVLDLNRANYLSKNILIIRNPSNGLKLYKKSEKSKFEISIDDLSEIGLAGDYEVYLKTKVLNKIFLKRSPFIDDNSDKFITDDEMHLKLESVEDNSNLSLRLSDYYNISDDEVNITKVYGEDISQIINDTQSVDYKLSAIVLVYNGGEYLKTCLDSLVNQTLDGLEIILINDKSTDNSLDICKYYAKDHDNVKIIDKQENHGLATSANMGIQIARGEYVILVDNDDIIPPDAYEKLYAKAKECDADISIGMANLLMDDRQNEMYNAERRVVEEEMVIDGISEFPELFNDAFYWNKIIKRSLLVENDIKLPTGMVYADRKFTHTAYVHAKRISIIPDCVYIWRIRSHDDDDQSLSQKRNETWNYINRIDSYELELDSLTDAFPQYFKILMRRVIIPIRGILNSPEFEDVFYNRGVKLLKQECNKLDDIYDNQFDNWDNIMLYLSLNERKDEIRQMLELDLKTRRQVIDRNNKSYWNLPLFEENNDIPDELFEIKSLIVQFLNIGKITTTPDEIIFDDIRLPKYVNVSRCEINFMGKTYAHGDLLKNTLSYELKPLGENIFSLRVPLSDLADFEVYDMFFKVYYPDRLSDAFRITRESIHSIEESSKDLIIALTKYGNFSVISQRFSSIFKDIHANEDFMKFTLNENKHLKQDLMIKIRNDLTNETIVFMNNEELNWKNFLESNSAYSFYVSGFNSYLGAQDIQLTEEMIVDFEEISLKNLKIFSDGEGNIKLISN